MNTKIRRLNHVLVGRAVNRGRSLLRLLAAGTGIVFLSGCAAARLKGDFRGYESAYAESSNRQLLLNLARLEQHHPTFFFKLGQISTGYKFTASMPNAITQTEKPQSGAWTGTPNVGFEKTPQFTFIPVSDDTLAERLLKPVPANFFYILYQQGWRVDQLFRLMVDRIELRKPGSDVIEVFRNVPTAANFEGYATFLRVSAIARELQQNGMLILDGQKNFVPVARGWQRKDQPEVKDLWDAQTKNALWKSTSDGRWELGQEKLLPIFRLNLPAGDAARRAQELERFGSVIAAAAPEVGKSESLMHTLKILEGGFTIQETFDATNQLVRLEQGSCHLVMRSLIGLMGAAAQEQAAFEELLARPEFSKLVPNSQRQPLLRLVWAQGHPDLTPPLVQLEYAQKIYRIADEKSSSALTASSWNRDVFRLIAQLASQVTVDISKFPLPEILQLRSN